MDKPKRRRVRTGCLTCRERHLKCDEGVPDCVNCIKSRKVCRRGIRLNFIDCKVGDAEHYEVSDSWRPRIFDESRDIAAGYDGGLGLYARYPTPANDVDMDDVVVTQSAPKSISTAAPLGASLPNPLQAFRPPQVHKYAYSSARGMTLNDPTTPSRDPDVSELLPVYVEYIAPMLDLFCGSEMFSKVVPVISLTQPTLRYSVLCCGAVILAHKQKTAEAERRAEKYFLQATKSLLGDMTSSPKDLELCVLSTICLSVYELIQEVSEARGRRISGVNQMIEEFHWVVMPTGRPEMNSIVEKCCFWANMMIDFIFSRRVDSGPFLNPHNWGSVHDVHTLPSNTPPDAWWMHSILHLSACANYISQQCHVPTYDEFVHNQRWIEWKKIVLDIKRWKERLPSRLGAIVDLKLPSNQSHFDTVLFASSSAMYANICYHGALLLMNKCKPYTAYPIHDPEVAIDVTYHSRRIMGINRQTKHVIHAIMSLWAVRLACFHISNYVEQVEICQHLDYLEEAGAWKTSDTREFFQGYWGWNN
ncbi:Adhesion and hyphal regulator 1 [Yarrowia sp. B02]|nr:Adhesion and hyphal regulator 1 [Yarrowia sp. B02]